MVTISKNYKPTIKEKFMNSKMKEYFRLKLISWKKNLLKESSETLKKFQKLKNYYVIERVFVEDVQKKHTTEVMFSDVQVDSGIDKNLFQEKNLKRIPRDQLNEKTDLFYFSNNDIVGADQLHWLN